jgi:hypothetical protein
MLIISVNMPRKKPQSRRTSQCQGDMPCNPSVPLDRRGVVAVADQNIATKLSFSKACARKFLFARRALPAA